MKIPSRFVLGWLAFVPLLGAPIPAAAIEAHPFRQVAEGEPSIDLVKDHYSVQFLAGWVSSEDRFFQAVLAKRTQLVESMYTSVKYFDDPPKEYFSRIQDQEDLKRGTARRWGGQQILVDTLPADIRAELRFKLLVHREERLKPVLAGLAKAAPGAGALDPWLGYTSAVTSVLDQLPEASVTSVPFEWEGPIKTADVLKGDVMRAHYLFLIAPRDDRDRVELSGEKLAYENGWLLYDGERITSNSWAVLRVYRSPSPKINVLRLESRQPWAIVASKIYRLSVTDLDDAGQLVARVKGFIDLLETEQSLLKQEHRFSAYDRAVALQAQTLFLAGRVRARCDLTGIAERDCPSQNLKDYGQTLALGFGSIGDWLADVDVDAARLTGEALLAQKEYDLAADYLERVVAARPDDPQALYALGTARFEAGEYETAASAPSRAVALQESSPDTSDSALSETLSTLSLVERALGQTAAGAEVKEGEASGATSAVMGEAAAAASDAEWALDEQGDLAVAGEGADRDIVEESATSQQMMEESEEGSEPLPPPGS